MRVDRFASISLTSLGMSLAALPVLPFVVVPGPHVWPWIVTSLLIHIGYRLFLILAYEAGDLAQTYPLARGTAPLMTTIGGIFLIGEIPGPLAIAGIVLLSAGTLLDVGSRWVRPRQAGHTRRRLRACHIGIRGRLHADRRKRREACRFGIQLCRMAVPVRRAGVDRHRLLLSGRRLLAIMAKEWKIGILTGVLSAGSYWIAMWAMTKAPIASVAALRETSILLRSPSRGLARRKDDEMADRGGTLHCCGRGGAQARLI